MVPSERLSGIDGLRWMLASIVVVAHTYTIFFRPFAEVRKRPIDWFWVLSSRYAVLGFFAVSGYVIALSIMRNREANGRFNPWQYTSSRFFRIMPPLAFAIVLALVLEAVLVSLGKTASPGITGEREIFTVDLVAQLSALATLGLTGQLAGNINGPLWSLAYEMQAYVFAGALACGKRGWLVAGLFAAALAATDMTALHMVCFACFAAGSIAAITGLPRWVAPVALTVSGVTLWLANVDSLDRDWFGLASQATFGIGFAALIIVLKDRMPAMSRRMDVSYSLYIFHYPVLLAAFFLAQPIESPVMVAMAGLAVVVAVVFLVGPWVENASRWRSLFKAAGRLAQQHQPSGR
jgi:peptidoglycan/LPS O-acetylase OafA/YrhL